MRGGGAENNQGYHPQKVIAAHGVNAMGLRTESRDPTVSMVDVKGQLS